MFLQNGANHCSLELTFLGLINFVHSFHSGYCHILIEANEVGDPLLSLTFTVDISCEWQILHFFIVCSKWSMFSFRFYVWALYCHPPPKKKQHWIQNLMNVGLITAPSKKLLLTKATVAILNFVTLRVVYRLISTCA